MLNRNKVWVRATSIILAFLALAIPLSAAQTKVKPGMNFFSIEQDIQFGRQAAAEIERQMPMVQDPFVQEWIDGLGRRLAARTTMPNLPWRFRVVNSSDINAFALPGGFLYFNRGLIDITEDESEIAGVMGHEMAHVTLRHGTNQLSKGMMYQAPLAVLGSLGGAVGAIGQVGAVGLSLAFLKFSRDAEKDADVLGVQTMVKAGYDPNGMVRVFEKLQQHGAGKGPQFLSDHPNPDKRIERIQKEMRLLNASGGTPDSSGMYPQARRRLGGMGTAPRITPRGASGSTNRQPSGVRSRPGEPPSRNFVTYRSADGLYQLNYPSNWQAYSQAGSNVTLAPEWAIEGNEITRGAMVNFFSPQERYRGTLSLEDAADLIVRQLTESNPNLREERDRRYQGRLGGRGAVATFLSGRNTLGHDERVWLIVRPSGDGLIYLLFIAPDREFNQYQVTFEQMVRSMAVNDR